MPVHAPESQPLAVSAPSLPPKGTGIKRLSRAFCNSLHGIGSALRHEAAFRQEGVAGLALVAAAFILPFDTQSRLLLVGVVFLVWITELLNSAIEWVVDYISLERHPFAKRAKDMGSGAVFLSLLLCALVWGLTLHSQWGELCAWWRG